MKADGGGAACAGEEGVAATVTDNVGIETHDEVSMTNVILKVGS